LFVCQSVSLHFENTSKTHVKMFPLNTINIDQYKPFSFIPYISLYILLSTRKCAVMCLPLCILQLIHDINRTELISVDEGGQVQTVWTARPKDTNSNYQQFGTELWVLWAKVWVELALSICIALCNSHRFSRPVSTADNYSVFMAVICTETSALLYSPSTVLPDQKHEAVNFECLV